MKSISIIVFLSVSNCLFGQAYSSFDTTAIKKHFEFLASDALKGRATGSKETKIAAQYFIDFFRENNFVPFGENSTFRQRIFLHGSKPLSSSEFTLFQSDDTTALNFGKDYVLFKTGEQTYLPTPTETIFVGYGINAPEYDYNDYQNIDAEGKIVVVLDGEPDSDELEYFDGKFNSVYSLPESKIRLAMAQGAEGILIIPLKPKSDEEWGKKQREFSFEDVSLPARPGGIFAAYLRAHFANLLFEGTNLENIDLLDLHKKSSVNSLPLNSKISFLGKFKQRDFYDDNIIAGISGKEESLSDSYLLVTAHYDHLGIGPAVNGDSIYNGALDNSLGCAVLLELAKQLKAVEGELKRSVIFILLTGEEKELLGSRYYCSRPVVPLFKSVANINIDGIAVIDEFNSIVPVGEEYSTIGSFVEKVAEKNNLEIESIENTNYTIEAFARSDQIAFAQAGIPSLLLIDGTDYKNVDRATGMKTNLRYFSENYHTPSDDLNLEVNFNAVNQHAEILFQLCFELLTSENEPEWFEGSPFINERLRTIAEKR
ncbi:MAG: M28 family peptidase [Melioribacteraceae bacterium]|nr:M28 family peptidase [Melioribacteraceae bacterium]MCF8431146.1 M28 family peptidase [Melioribacteraceae bacterium]